MKEQPQYLVIVKDPVWYDHLTNKENRWPSHDSIIRYIDSGVMDLCLRKEAKEKGYVFEERAINLNNNYTYFVRSPYDSRYLSLEENLQANYEPAFLLAYKEALKDLGAKRIAIVKDADVYSKMNIGGEIGGKGGAKSGKVSAKYTKEDLNKFLMEIGYADESNQPNYEGARDRMQNSAIGKDPQLALLLDRLERDGKLSGLEGVHIKTTTEEKKAFDFALNLKLPVCKLKADFQYQVNTLKSEALTIAVNFDNSSEIAMDVLFPARPKSLEADQTLAIESQKGDTDEKEDKKSLS